MVFSDFEHILGNFSFACLLVMVIWYWAKTIFSFSSSLNPVGTFGVAAANLSLTGLLVLRWLESNHFPLSNLYESLLFLSWGFTAFHLVIGGVSRADFAGVVTSPIALLTNAFANFSLPHEMQKATALIPALQSNWLMMHVTVMMVSYVALISGSLLSIAFLVVSYYDRKRGERNSTGSYSPLPPVKTPWGSIAIPVEGGCDRAANQRIIGVLAEVGCGADSRKQSSLLQGARNDLGNMKPPRGSFRNFIPTGVESFVDSQEQATVTSELSTLSDLSPFAKALDNLSYRTLGLGFPLLTIGILSGAVWANEAWGSYWSWDPKETWAFITWIVFAIYLHTRLSRGWKGTGPAVIAAAGFFVVWMCYLGVNLLGTGLHSYGWLRDAV
jgi:cytochrome c-type biogenesis protein CcsB